MRLTRISILNYLANRLPLHKRTPKRIKVFFALLAPFSVMMEEYVTWRDQAVTRAQVTGETISLQWYLNYLYDPTDQRIEIDTADVSGIPAGLQLTESAYYIAAGIEATEPTTYAAIPLPGEDTDFGDYSFIVRVPAALSGLASLITATVNNYRAGGRTFKIVYS